MFVLWETPFRGAGEFDGGLEDPAAFRATELPRVVASQSPTLGTRGIWEREETPFCGLRRD